jgi:cytochrome P450
LPDVFEDPHSFKPERFAPAAKKALPKGAYVPFGAGPRTCIGMRFGQLEIKTVATLVLQRFRPAVPAAHSLHVRQMPTLSPEGGLPMALREREAL